MSDGITATISLTFDPTRPGEAGRVLDMFSHLLTELSRQGVPTTVLSPEPGPDPGDDLDADDEPAPVPPKPVVNASSTQAPPKRVRDRTAERRAAREKAEAEAKAAGTTNGAEVDDPLLGTGAGPGTGDPFGDDADDAPLPAKPDPEPVERVRTPKECMDGSIVLLRQCFANGGAEAVKALQKTYKVSKFIDLPLDAAPGLWKQSLDLARTLQIKIPPGL
jgi:hypothetical protein